MLRHRVIPVLLNSNDGLVKTMNFKNPTYIGDPINAVRIFNEKQVDELIILDIDRSKLRLGPNLSLIRAITPGCFMPVSYGGGIRNLNDAKEVFDLGIEKIVIQNTLFSDMNIVNKIATTYGSQSVIASIDIYRDSQDKFFVYDSAQNRKLNMTLETILLKLKNSLIGELIITSYDREGTLSGFDLELIMKVKNFIKVPIIAHGGAGKIEDLSDAITAGADAVAAGSLFVFYGSRDSILINYPKYEHIERFLR
jgi:cyclase